MKTRFFLPVLLLVFSLGISYVYAAATWTGPTTAPPGNNTDTPINVGAITQTKVGDAVGGDICVQNVKGNLKTVCLSEQAVNQVVKGGSENNITGQLYELAYGCSVQVVSGRIPYPYTTSLYSSPVSASLDLSGVAAISRPNNSTVIITDKPTCTTFTYSVSSLSGTGTDIDNYYSVDCDGRTPSLPGNIAAGSGGFPAVGMPLFYTCANKPIGYTVQ